MSEPTRSRYRVELRDAAANDPEVGPVEVRLRRALKCLLRSFGLRCVRIEPLPPDEKEPK